MAKVFVSLTVPTQPVIMVEAKAAAARTKKTFFFIISLMQARKAACVKLVSRPLTNRGPAAGGCAVFAAAPFAKIVRYFSASPKAAWLLPASFALPDRAALLLPVADPF